MLLDGEWSGVYGNDEYALKLGRTFRAEIKRLGGDSAHANAWVASLNGERVVQTGDLEYAKGVCERLIVDELHRVREPFKKIRDRAPPSEAIWSSDGWTKWKTYVRQVHGNGFVGPGGRVFPTIDAESLPAGGEREQQ